MKILLVMLCLVFYSTSAFCWGFFGHKHINYHAVFLLPPEMILFYKQNIGFLTEHAVDPDKRRYAVKVEGPRHFIDLDKYGVAPFDNLPRKWNDAVAKYSEDSLMAHGIGPWWVQVMTNRLTTAFRNRDAGKILRLSAELGHYIADLHVPLHASSNHNGQHTNQHGIHGFWESRIPELLAEKKWDFFIGHATYIKDPLAYIWERVIESSASADTVLRIEKKLSETFRPDQKYAYENRNGVVIRQYSTAYSLAYDRLLNNMIERRMRMSVYAVACYWFTAWANAGQPDLKSLSAATFSDEDLKEFGEMNLAWSQADSTAADCEIK